MRSLILFLSLSVAFAADDAVFTAVRNNQLPAVQAYLDQKGDPNGRDEKGHTLLILAAYNGSLETVDLLLRRGADSHLQDGMGTALMAASFKGFTPIVRKLLATGAKVDERNGMGATALMFASLSGRFAVARLLMNHRADVAAVDQRGLDARKLAEGQGNAPMVQLLDGKR